MSIKVTCQYTGIEFDAASKRSKNHPAVAKFLDDASSDRFKNGAYAEAKRLLVEARGQFDNIDDLMAAVNEAYTEWYNAAPGVKVKTMAERKAIGEAMFRSATRQSGMWDELNDGVGGGQAGRKGFW